MLDLHWRAIAGIAEAHHGIVTSDQLELLEVSRQQRRTLVTQGRLRVHEDGVFYVVGHPVTWRTRALARCKALDGCAFAATAAMLHGLADPMAITPGYTEVLVPTRSRVRARESTLIFRSQRFETAGTVALDNVPSLPLLETLVSVGQHHDVKVFRSAFNGARRKRLITLPAFERRAAPFLVPGVRHRQNLEKALAAMTEEVPLSDWSDRFADWCRERGLPQPTLEYRILDQDGRLVAQVDVCWPDCRVVVELDSWSWHHSRASFEKDRARYAKLSSQGWVVIAVTWSRWKRDSEALYAELVAALNLHG